MSLQYDVSCLTQILNFYAALGLYHADPEISPFLDATSTVFTVVVKCCDDGSDC
jgi:hypothetical protein